MAYVEKEKAIEIVKSGGYWEYEDMEVAVACIEQTPTAEVVEVKHGEWKNVVVYNDTCIATCSNCRQQIVERECNATAFKLENEFCRKCGADMRGGKNDL